MKKTIKLNNFFLKGLIILSLILTTYLIPFKASAEISQTEINGESINASSEFLRDLDYETWQLVAYNSTDEENKLILRIIGYPGSLRLDHPLDLNVESGRKKWLLKDITLENDKLVNDNRQAAAEFDLESLIENISKNKPLRLSLPGVFSELPVPPFLVKEWRSID